jgi:hypothetical protein
VANYKALTRQLERWIAESVHETTGEWLCIQITASRGYLRMYIDGNLYKEKKINERARRVRKKKGRRKP